jgi:amidophosphoribosyltransferase
MARDAGANKVYFASAAPPVRFPNVYGIDMPTSAELIGHGRDEKQIAEAIGADRLFYQELDDLISAVLYKKNKTNVTRFGTSVFNGEYITGDITPEYLKNLESSRSDNAKEEREQRGNAVIEMHNNS